MISENRKKRTEQAENLQSVLGFYPPSISLLCIERNKSPEEKDKQKRTKQILTFLPTAKISFSFARPLAASLTQNNSQIALTLMVLSNSDQFLFVLFVYIFVDDATLKQKRSQQALESLIRGKRKTRKLLSRKKKNIDMKWNDLEQILQSLCVVVIELIIEERKKQENNQKNTKYIQPKQLRFLPFSKHINFKRKSEQLKSRCGE